MRKMREQFDYYKEKIAPEWNIKLVVRRTLKDVHGFCEADFDNKEAVIEINGRSEEKKETMIHELLHCLSSGLLEEANGLATSKKQKKKIEKLEEEMILRLEKILTNLL